MTRKSIILIVIVFMVALIMKIDIANAQAEPHNQFADIKLLDNCLARAIELHKNGHYKKAQKEFYFYEDNAEKYDSLYYYYRAFNDFYLKVYECSKEYFLWEYEKDTTNYELLYYLGVSYLLDSHSFEGILYLSKYIAHSTQNDMAYYYLAKALYNERQYQESYKYYKKSAELGNRKAKKMLRRKFNGKLLDNSNNPGLVDMSNRIN